MYLYTTYTGIQSQAIVSVHHSLGHRLAEIGRCMLLIGLLTAIRSSSTRVDTLEARLKELEARLKEVETVVPPGLPSGEYSVPAADVPQADLSIAANSSALTPESLTDILGNDGSGPNEKRGEDYQLPPLHEVLPWVSEYFATTNRAMPLFHEATFIRTLRDWYSTPVSQQDPAVWGVINVVLALSRRHLYLDISSPRGTLDVYVRNAQSVLNHLITRDEDLLGIQVVLGLAMIFYGTSDPKPATVLLATACRLAYALRLNTREFRGRGNELRHADDDLILQRQRVFWVLYINDRDISMRINQPALLHEADIDMELPEENPADGIGVLYASNGVHLNFFRKRAQFAWIQGKVYEWLFSVRAEKLPPAKKEENTRRLERALNQWDASLPEEFRPDMLPQITDITTFQNIMGLHFTHLQTLAIIHQSYSYNSHWLETLRRQSGKMMDESTNEDLRALLPKGWRNMVERSRSCLGLFSLLPEHNLYLVWFVSGPKPKPGRSQLTLGHQDVLLRLLQLPHIPHRQQHGRPASPPPRPRPAPHRLRPKSHHQTRRRNRQR